MYIYFLYILIYISICNWIQIYYLLGNVLKPKHTITSVDGKGLLTKLNKKTGLNLTIKVMSEKKKAIGFMISSPPFKPIMVFSEKLYELLTPEEFEWVSLHESAHYLMWHNLKFVLTQILIFLVGFYVVYTYKIQTYISFLLFILLSLLYIQIVKIFEHQADNYAVTHINNPNGMITANIKMKKSNNAMWGNTFLRKLLIIAVPYEKRIKMAENELIQRKKC